MKFSVIAALMPVVLGAAVPAVPNAEVEPRATRVCACNNPDGTFSDYTWALCYHGGGWLTLDNYCGGTNNQIPLEEIFSDANCKYRAPHNLVSHCKDI